MAGAEGQSPGGPWLHSTSFALKGAVRRYRGSADAVRRNLPVVLEPYRGTAVPDDLLILSGQALYRMVRPAARRRRRPARAAVLAAEHYA